MYGMPHGFAVVTYSDGKVVAGEIRAESGFGKQTKLNAKGEWYNLLATPQGEEEKRLLNSRTTFYDIEEGKINTAFDSNWLDYI